MVKKEKVLGQGPGHAIREGHRHGNRRNSPLPSAHDLLPAAAGRLHWDPPPPATLLGRGFPEHPHREPRLAGPRA